MPNPKTSIDLKGIASVLGHERLDVPAYQRSFAWTDIEVQELLDDIDEGYGRKEDYFLGTIVLITQDNGQAHQVLDGQQRLATIALLLAGIADHFQNADDGQRADAVRNQFLAKFNIPSGSREPQLRLNQVDDSYFRTLLSPTYDSPSFGAPDSHERLYAARERTSRWLAAKLESAANPLQWLIGFFNYLTDSSQAILVKVPDDVNAFLIFETLNDRGIDLSIADLVKNHLLGRAGSDQAIVLNLWTTALASLSAYGGENLFSIFLRHFWSSRHRLVREKELYRDIKRRVVSQPNVVDFANDIANEAYLYAAMLSDAHEFWSSHTFEAKESVRTLNLLTLQQYRPMLLAAMKHLPSQDLERLVRLLVNWNVRLLVTGRLGGGDLERQYAILGQAIRMGTLKSVAEITESAADFIPSDSEFHDAFAIIRVSKVNLARYYLRELEKQSRPQEQREVVPNPDETKLTLEHVLPERPLENWPQFGEDEAKTYVNRVGNLVLLAQRMNSQLRSAGFGEKQVMFSQSELILTREVGEGEGWSAKLIDDRQRHLADLAVRAWPLRL